MVDVGEAGGLLDHAVAAGSGKQIDGRQGRIGREVGRQGRWAETFLGNRGRRGRGCWGFQLIAKKVFLRVHLGAGFLASANFFLMAMISSLRQGSFKALTSSSVGMGKLADPVWLIIRFVSR